MQQSFSGTSPACKTCLSPLSPFFFLSPPLSISLSLSSLSLFSFRSPSESSSAPQGSQPRLPSLGGQIYTERLSPKEWPLCCQGQRLWAEVRWGDAGGFGVCTKPPFRTVSIPPSAYRLAPPYPPSWRDAASPWDRGGGEVSGPAEASPEGRAPGS